MKETEDLRRPSSYYDNLKDAETPAADMSQYPAEVELRDMSGATQEEGSPTQQFLLSTTVPQNMAALNIAGKHTPTRNSLRHSRMIVMNRSGNPQPRSYQPNVVRNYKLATTLAALQALFGAAICCLAAWLLLWARSLRRRDNPYWSGLPLLASGTFALMMMCCCRKGRKGTLQGYLVYGVKVITIMFSLVAATAGLIASVFAIIHLISLTAMYCDSQHLNESCICRTGVNSTAPVKTYHYEELTCPQVHGTLTYLLIFSCIVNFLAGVACLWYIYLHCSSKKVYTYAKVRTKNTENNNGVMNL